MSGAVEALTRKFGAPKRLICPLPSIAFPPISERKHGEVCMAILRKSGRFLLQTKASYPNSVMRLPSGGIKAGEDVEHALLREIWEETNLEVSVDRFVALLRYEDDNDRAAFQTFLFFVREIDGVLQTNDPNEKISEWLEARPEELPSYAEKLREIRPSWGNWGLFRAASIDALADFCSGSRF